MGAFEGRERHRRREPMVKAREIAYAVLEAVLERCCGLDVHKKKVTVCLLIGPLRSSWQLGVS